MFFNNEEIISRLSAQLILQGFELFDGDDFESNFLEKFKLFNKDKLNSVPLTGEEEQKILKHIYKNSIYECAKKIREKYFLNRDSKICSLSFYDSKDLNKNIFQVVKNFHINNKIDSKFGIAILLNGLPIIVFELNKILKNIENCFNKIKQNHNNNVFSNLWGFIQIFIISTEQETKYFSNNSKELEYKKTFFWSDKKNNKNKNLFNFTSSFLKKEHILKMIDEYMIIYEAQEKNKLLILRPYQIHAIEAIVNHVIKEKTEKIKDNGYIWHATGSGKTLTSFKVSQLLAKRTDIKKVIFVVDRKILDQQTTQEFNSFMKDAVDKTTSILHLIKQLKSQNQKLIVTTIQKLAEASRKLTFEKNRNLVDISHLEDGKTIFIFDECHRSIFGESLNAIKRTFNNIQLFGFTGTPIFEVNCRADLENPDPKTTAEIFNESLSNYMMIDAIDDQNVLPFKVEYFEIKRKENETDINNLCENVISEIQFPEITNLKSQLSEELKKQIKKKTKYIDSDDDSFKKFVVEKIIQHFDKYCGKKYNAILAVNKIIDLIKYYSLFKTLSHNLNVAAIFSFNSIKTNENTNNNFSNSEEDNSSFCQQLIKEFKEKYCKENTNISEQNYNSYVYNKFKNSKEIDLLIVVKMYLTGFDSQILNTLFIEKKELKYHDLIQAFSRTNRTFIDKTHGNIVIFTTPKQKIKFKKNIDDSISLFSQSNSIKKVLLGTYEEEALKTIEKWDKFKITIPNNENIQNIQNNKEFLEKTTLFKDVLSSIEILKSYSDFDYKDIYPVNTEDIKEIKYEFQNLKKRLKKTQFKNQITPEDCLIFANYEFEVEERENEIDFIDVSYILKLIENALFFTEQPKESDFDGIIMQIDKNITKPFQANCLKKFITGDKLNKLNEIKKSKETINVKKEYQHFVNEERDKEIIEFSFQNNLSFSPFKEVLLEINENGKDFKIKEYQAISDSNDKKENSFAKIKSLKNKIQKLIKKIY